MPGRLPPPVLVVGRRGGQTRGCSSAASPAEPQPQLGLRRASHRSPSSRSDPVVVEHPWPGSPRHRRGRRSTAAPGAGTRGPGTPRCCRCRRAPGWRSRTRSARLGRSRPWPRRPPPARQPGGRASTAQAACRRDAARPLHRHEGVGQQVLDGLERADGDAVLAPLTRVVAGQLHRAAHGPDQVGAGQRQPERRPAGESSAVITLSPTAIGPAPTGRMAAEGRVRSMLTVMPGNVTDARVDPRRAREQQR